MENKHKFEDPLDDIDPIMEQAFSATEDTQEDEEDFSALDESSQDDIVFPEDSFIEEADQSSNLEFSQPSTNPTQSLNTDVPSVSQNTPSSESLQSGYESSNTSAFEAQQPQNSENHESDYSNIEFPDLTNQEDPDKKLEKSLIGNIPVPVSVQLGQSSISLKEILELSEGSIIELERMVGEPLDLVVNDQTIARGEVVAIDNNYGLRITNVVATLET